MSIGDMTAHISNIRDKDFNPKASYSSKAYALQGSIKTDGYRIQLLAFKLNELSCVKYRRLGEDKLPDPLISTLGVTDHYLTETRNVVKTTEDDCDPKEIEILAIDLGQAFVVGASALLSSFASTTPIDGEEQGAITEIDVSLPTQFHNLAVNQKAVYEQRKGRAVEGTESITDKETNLPSLRRPEASITEYVETFYNNVTLEKHQ
ncbi:hypothetical protein EC957_000186 [Mortierella hygrophila]|uniref:Uncharacterized protein n=1 Tax=Mortierella hygrophila TaxID=979708 RepID=A0A9P6FGV2_9FUNG|nr:hypothetical protein EC957_000186 [Mortierella hygrophila]